MIQLIQAFFNSDLPCNMNLLAAARLVLSASSICMCKQLLLSMNVFMHVDVIVRGRTRGAGAAWTSPSGPERANKSYSIKDYKIKETLS